ncbi:hypothetical protein HOY80DRAFT_221233 [Tuber brumale]|nr:hypothetical protein HOY80DRAFT_221233 [Tuber brumale]
MAVRTAMEEAPSLTLSQSEFEVMVRKMLGFGLIDRLTELQSTSTGQEEQLANPQPSPLNIDTPASQSPTFEGLGRGLLRSPKHSPRRSPSRASAQEDSIFDALRNSPKPYAEGGDSVGDDSTGFIGGPPIDSSTPIRARNPVNFPGPEPTPEGQSLRQRRSANTEEARGEEGKLLAVNPMWLEMSLEPAALSGLTVENLRDLLQEFRQFWEDFETRRRRLEEVDRKLNQANQRYAELTAYWEQRYDTIENGNQALQKEKEKLAEEAKKFESQYTKGSIMIRTMEDEIAKSETRIEELERFRKQEVRRREEVQLLLQREINTAKADRAKLTEIERMNEKLLSEAKNYIRDVDQLQTEISSKNEELNTRERDIADRDMRIENLEKELNKVKGDCQALESQSRSAYRAPKGSVRSMRRRLGEEIGSSEPEELAPLPQSEGAKDTDLTLSGLGTSDIGGQEAKGVSSLIPEPSMDAHHLETIIAQGAYLATGLPIAQSAKTLSHPSDAESTKNEPGAYDSVPRPAGQKSSEATSGQGGETENPGNTRGSGGAAGGAGGSDHPDSSSDGDSDAGRGNRAGGRGGGDPGDPSSEDDDGGRGSRGHGGRGGRGDGRRGKELHDPRVEDGRGVWVGQFRFTGIDGEYIECIRTTLETRAYLKDLADKPRLTIADVKFLTNFIREQSSPPDQAILQEIWGLAPKAERAARRTLREEAWPARGEKAAFGLVSVNSPFGIFAWPWRQLWDIAFSLDDADYQLPGTNAYQDYINEKRARTARGGNDDDNVNPPTTAQPQSGNDPGIRAKRINSALPRRPHQTPVASILRAGPKPGAAWGILTFLGLGLVLTLAIYNSLIFLRMRSDQQSWEFANGSRSSAGPFWSVENSCWSNCLSGIWGGPSQSSRKWQQWEWFWTLLEDWVATNDEGQILPS